MLYDFVLYYIILKISPLWGILDTEAKHPISTTIAEGRIRSSLTPLDFPVGTFLKFSVSGPTRPSTDLVNRFQGVFYTRFKNKGYGDVRLKIGI